MDMKALVAALETIVFERLPDGRFVARSGIPAWCRALRRDVDWESPLVLDDVFPFLSVFLPVAERAWSSEVPVRAESDVWVETDATGGGDIHLLAAAVSVESVPALLVVRSERLFVQNQTLLQRARELRMLHASLMKQMEEKDILVHAIIHDLVAPLHSIFGVLSLLGERVQEGADGEWVRVGVEAATRQRELIADILDVFTAEVSSFGEVDPGGVDLANVLDRVVTEREPVARTRRVRIEIVGRPSEHVVGERMRLFRVLTNLLDNALRYAPPESVVHVGCRHDADTVVVSVDDEGPGVPPELMPHLFEKLARGRDRLAGTGLGLFFCRITVENWGGGIGYERLEPGSRFWIRLRSAPAVASERARPTKEGRKNDGEAAHAR